MAAAVATRFEMRQGTPFVLRNGRTTSYKIPEFADRDDGYDGRLDWTLSYDNLQLMAVFRNAVLAKNFDKVKSIVQIMSPSFQNECQVDQFCQTICDRSSAEPLKESLLTAICIGSRPLVEFILVLFNEYPGEERSGCYDSAAFMPHMTPLMMACICNNFAIVECLLMRSHEIELPHRADCVCDLCGYDINIVTNSIQRLDTYRAISSEAFLWLATADPLQAAMTLSRDLQICADTRYDHQELYNKLCKNVDNFATSIVQQCWTQEEVDILLRQPDGSTISDCHLPYPRVRQALDVQIKPLLAHLNVQIAVENKWLGKWTDWGQNMTRDFGRIMRHTLFFPFLAFLHSISAGTLVDSFNYPLARFMSFTMSYVLFLVSLTVVEIIKSSSYGSAYDRDLLNNKYVFYLDSYNLMFICGLFMGEFLEFARRGIDIHLRMWWRWFDFIFLALYTFAVMFWITSVCQVHDDRLTAIHRRHWLEYDPYLFYDIFYAGAIIMAFWRIFYFVQLYRFIGSTVISIGKCVARVYHFFIIMAVLITCFSIGTSSFLHFYTGNKHTLPDGTVKEMRSMWMDVPQSMRILYWAYYGYLHPDDYDIIVGDAGPDHTPTRHRATRNAAEIVVAIYYIILIVTLVNLMISLLVKTAHEVLQEEGVEWKYVRVNIFYEYFEHTSAVPPPFNLIYMMSCLVYRLFSSEFTFLWPDLFVKRDVVNYTEELKQNRKSYHKLITLLFYRYRSSKEYHYKTVQTLDFDKSSPLMKVAFMNAPPNAKDDHTVIDKNHPLVKEFQRSREETKKSRQRATSREKCD